MITSPRSTNTTRTTFDLEFATPDPSVVKQRDSVVSVGMAFTLFEDLLVTSPGRDGEYRGFIWLSKIQGCFRIVQKFQDR